MPPEGTTYAINLVAAIHGSPEPDVLEDTYCWHTRDIVGYAVIAATAYPRACAQRHGQPLPQFIDELDAHWPPTRRPGARRASSGQRHARQQPLPGLAGEPAPGRALPLRDPAGRAARGPPASRGTSAAGGRRSRCGLPERPQTRVRSVLLRKLCLLGTVAGGWLEWPHPRADLSADQA
jgi:hypothetical protein